MKTKNVNFNHPYWDSSHKLRSNCSLRNLCYFCDNTLSLVITFCIIDNITRPRTYPALLILARPLDDDTERHS